MSEGECRGDPADREWAWRSATWVRTTKPGRTTRGSPPWTRTTSRS